MRRLTLVFLSLFSLGLIETSVCIVFGEVSDTAKIMFGTYRDGNRELYLMNPDGSKQVNITNHRADDVSGTWSPTGDQILFASNRDQGEGWDLYLMDADGKNVHPVFEKPAIRSTPTWSPDGKQIAYMRTVRGVWYVYMATSGGKNEERLAIGGSPAWSPDGSEIAYVVSVGPERLNIYIFNLQTRKQNHFFPPDDVSTAREPDWSPDGNKLAFMWHQKRPQDEGEIYTLNRDGTSLQELVRKPGVGAAAPVWSPRGDALVYRGRLKPIRQTHVFKITLDGRGVEQLTDISIWNVPDDWFDPAFALPVSPQRQLLTTIWGELKRE
ncbi:MAG: hypothetical protein OXG97_17140 [Candidatus Poribacteria bacterium]|nr:hypothetical protein [Candidatus Poribacteria bacterium]